MGDDARLRQLIGDLGAAFPRATPPNATLRLYVRELADLPIAALERAVPTIIRTSEFFPTIRTIREAVAELTLELPNEHEALEQINARVAWGRKEERLRGDAPEIHPLVLRALNLVGGWPALRSAEKPSVMTGQFLRLYRELRAARILDVQVGRELAPGPTRPELSP